LGGRTRRFNAPRQCHRRGAGATAPRDEPFVRAARSATGATRIDAWSDIVCRRKIGDAFMAKFLVLD
jgi:hypothetical protein